MLMIEKYDQSVEINQNTNWSYTSENPYRILIISGSGTGKTNALLYLMKHQRPDIDKMYLYVEDPFESKCRIAYQQMGKVSD